MNRISRSISLVIIFAAINLVGCATAPSTFDQYQAAITQFQLATDKTSIITLKYIQDMNHFERNVKIEELRSNPEQNFSVRAILKEEFDPVGIETRKQAFQVINSYTSMLAKLADSDAESQWVAATGELKKSVDKMAGSEDVSAYTSSLVKIADFAGKNWINSKRSMALDEAIESAAPAIQEISLLISKDMEEALDLRMLRVNIPLTEFSEQYAAIKAEPASAARDKKLSKKLDELVTILDKRDSTMATLKALQNIMLAFDEAHSSLINYAESEKGAQSVSDLIVSVNRYSTLADSLFDLMATPKK